MIFIKFGGITKKYKENKTLMNFFLPILKTDLKILENYTYKSTKSKLDIKFNIFYGKQDCIAKINDMQVWNIYTQDEIRFFKFQGNHFFINQNMFELVNVINESLIAEI